MTTIAEKMTAEKAYEIALKDPIRRITDKKIIEEAILTLTPGQRVYITDYAENVLKRRWSEGEAVILSNTTNLDDWFRAKLIVDYAENVIKDRWLEAEKFFIDIAAKDLNNSISVISEYFMNLVCGYTWVGRTTGRLHQYGSDNRGRWLEFEHILHQIQIIRSFHDKYEDQHEYWSQAYEAKKCYDYAKDVVKGRWVEGEEIIKKHEYWWKMYQKFISGVSTNSSNSPNTKLEDLKKARAELDAKIKLLETQG